MKIKSVALLTLMLICAMLLSACELGTYQAAASKPSQNVDASVVTTPTGGEDEIENPFTVTVTYQGQVYIPTVENPISALWSDGYSLHEAAIGPDGVAKIGGLDGDYRVTLTNVPEGYAYNPNIYNADNENRHVEIELHQIIPTTGKGAGLYNPIEIQNTGVYCIEVSSADQETYFGYSPNKNGVYTVESWMDVEANEVNPVATYWGANAAFKTLVSTHDGGGAEGSYTRNFVMDVKIADANISNGGSSVQFTFGISATSKDGKYPIKVYIAITRDGEFDYGYTPAPIVAPAEIPLDANGNAIPSATPNGTFQWAETYKGGATIFDGSQYKLWPKDQGGDGYYHKYDAVKYASNGGYGPVLYAAISTATRFLEGQDGATPFTMIEYYGNKALTLDNGEYNYKLFIEGWDYLNYTGLYADPVWGKVPYFCDFNCPCRQSNTCTSAQMGLENGTCETGCTSCSNLCRNLPREMIGMDGYAQFCNSDGMAPVTQELRTFLQKFAISQLLFMDGQGYVETHPRYNIFAAEDDQWLFACGYYE